MASSSETNVLAPPLAPHLDAEGAPFGVKDDGRGFSIPEAPIFRVEQMMWREEMLNAGAFPSRHWARGRVPPKQVAGLMECVGDNSM